MKSLICSFFFIVFSAFGQSELKNFAYISTNMPSEWLFGGMDNRLVLEDKMTVMMARVLEKEKDWKEKPPSSIRNLILTLQFIGMYNAEMLEQPGYLSKDGPDKNRIRVGAFDIHKRKGVAWGVGEGKVYAPAVMRPSAKSVVGLAFSWPIW